MRGTLSLVPFNRRTSPCRTKNSSKKKGINPRGERNELTDLSDERHLYLKISVQVRQSVIPSGCSKISTLREAKLFRSFQSRGIIRNNKKKRKKKMKWEVSRSCFFLSLGRGPVTADVPNLQNYIAGHDDTNLINVTPSWETFLGIILFVCSFVRYSIGLNSRTQNR